jgi:Tfp pilus assembly protein PilX
MVSKKNQRSWITTRQRPHRGVALLMCLFLVFMVSTLVLNIAQTETLQLAMTRNSIEYEQSLYWANAGVHHVCAQLLADTAWRGTVTDGALPPTLQPAGYTATAIDDGLGNVLVTARGYSGNGSRTLSATIEF